MIKDAGGPWVVRNQDGRVINTAPTHKEAIKVAHEVASLARKLVCRDIRYNVKKEA